MAFHLTHPDSDQEIEVDREQVPMYLSAGWQTKSGVKAPEPEAPVPVLPED